jgi:hypothetical protein
MGMLLCTVERTGAAVSLPFACLRLLFCFLAQGGMLVVTVSQQIRHVTLVYSQPTDGT